jgi:hypothetical protein
LVADKAQTDTTSSPPVALRSCLINELTVMTVMVIVNYPSYLSQKVRFNGGLPVFCDLLAIDGNIKARTCRFNVTAQMLKQ